jgi:hypothetical protein
MLRLVFCASLAWSAMGQCIAYETPVTLEGKLAKVDEAGYNSYFVIRLSRPICLLGSPNDALEHGCSATK